MFFFKKKILNLAQSLGVENVDADIIKQPPRNVREPLINRSLIISIISSAAIIISGTLFVFYKEVFFNIFFLRCLGKTYVWARP